MTTLHFTPVVILIAFLLILPEQFAERVRGIRILPLVIILWLFMEFVPIGPLPVNAYLQGIIGELSISSLILVGWLFFQRQTELSGTSVTIKHNHRWFDIKPTMWMIVVLSLALYPAALGLGYIDTYSWGFDPTYLFFAITILGVALAINNFFLAASVIALALLGYTLKIQSSLNLWDYLIDPILAIACWVRLLRLLLKRFRDYGLNKKNVPVP